jgi:hypothetical protein
MIEAGSYLAFAVPMEGEDGVHLVRWARTKEKKPQILVYFEITEGPHAGERYPWFGYFTKETYERTIQSLRYMGWKGDDLEKLGALSQEVSIAIGHNEWEGKIRARVDWVNRAGGAAMKLNDPMTAGDLRLFASKIKAVAGKIREVAGKVIDRATHTPEKSTTPAQPSLPAEHERQPGEDDDIPF